MRRSVLSATVRMLPVVSVQLTIALAVLTLVQPVLGLGFMLAVGHLIGQIPALVAGRDSDWALALASVAGIYVVQHTLTSVAAIVEWRLGQRLNHYLDDRVMVLLQAPAGIAHLEDARIRDLSAEVADGLGAGWFRPTKTPAAVRHLTAAALGLVLAFGVVIWLQWWLGLALAAAAVWAQYAVTRHSVVMILGFQSSGEADFRRMEYEREVAVSAASAKEVRLFDFGPWVLSRWESRLRAILALDLANIARVTPSVILSVATLSLVTAGGFAWAAVQVGNDGLGLAAATVLAQAMLAPLVQFGPAGQAVINLSLCTKPVRSLLDLERQVAADAGDRSRDAAGDSARDGAGDSARDGAGDRDGAITSPNGSTSAPRQTPARPGVPTGTIRLDHVTFRYPGRDVDVLDELSLTIPAGSSLAVVGLNGAGKTTLVKLLCRFYEPTSGRITVGGEDLRTYDQTGWQRNVAAIFQDFARYPESASDNVGFGNLSASPARIDAVATRTGAAKVVAGLPAGWDTVLSREFTGGTDLSGGQWQRVALSRALLAADAGAGLLILDEPAANLDVRAEAELNDSFLDLTQGVTTLVISHRFSTVRRADRICVLSDGRLVEHGSHDELVDAGGRYAEMFRLQAERFEI